MARWLKNHEDGKMYRVVIRNNVSGALTHYGPYSQLGPAKSVRGNMLNNYANRRREVPNIGWVEETQTQWYRIDD